MDPSRRGRKDSRVAASTSLLGHEPLVLGLVGDLGRQVLEDTPSLHHVHLASTKGVGGLRPLRPESGSQRGVPAYAETEGTRSELVQHSSEPIERIA